MASLLTLLPDATRCGVFQSTLLTDEIVIAAKTLGFEPFKLDLGKARSKGALLEQIAKSLRFPAHFGKNWDALNDCLCDLSWLKAKGHVIIATNGVKFATDHEDDFATLIEILQTVADFWREQKKPFWVFVEADYNWELDLPTIAGQ